MVTIFVQREHLDGNVARGGILLQMAQYRPAKHIWQKNIEHDGAGSEFTRQRSSEGALHRYHPFETALPHQLQQQTGKMRIVFNDEDDRIARQDRFAINADLFGLHRLLDNERPRSYRACAQEAH